MVIRFVERSKGDFEDFEEAELILVKLVRNYRERFYFSLVFVRRSLPRIIFCISCFFFLSFLFEYQRKLKNASLDRLVEKSHSIPFQASWCIIYLLHRSFSLPLLEDWNDLRRWSMIAKIVPKIGTFQLVTLDGRGAVDAGPRWRTDGRKKNRAGRIAKGVYSPWHTEASRATPERNF